VWTTQLGRHCLSTRFGVESCRERARQVPHALGVRLRRRRHRHLQAKPAEPAALRAELAEVLAAWPEEWALSFGDEATVRRHPPLTAQGWVVDAVPEVPTGDDHTKGQVDGAVAPLAGRTRAHVRAELGPAEVARFLRHLMTDHPGKRRLVLHDRGTQPTGAAVEDVVREAQGRLMRKAQPASAPELKPHERLWQWLRRAVTHHHGCATLHEPLEAIHNFFRYLAGVKDQVCR
jgi:hypothetical protein